MNIEDIIKNRRTIRRFQQQEIELELLESLVDCARLAPSGGNLQPLEFVIVTGDEQRINVFSRVKWASYIAPAGNPPEGYQPAAYIIVLVNTDIRKERFEFDVGAAVENILLAAWGKGLASCWIGNFVPDEIGKILELPGHVIPKVVIALGYPAEESIVEPLKDSSEYYKDEEGLFHVPKRSLESIVHHNKY